MHKISRGLNLPITGDPEQNVVESRPVETVGLIGDDYIQMRPTMAVEVGDTVKLGQLLFADKKTEGVKFTSPGAGKVIGVNRGARRKFLSVAIELEGEDQVGFQSYPADQLGGLSTDQVKENLVESGLWTSLRTRPFSKVPAPATAPHSIFVTAVDSNPLAVDAKPIIEENREAFTQGLTVLSKLTEGALFVCSAVGADLPGGGVERVQIHEFSGPHPSGAVGTHIHLLDPVGPQKTVWYIGYQDVIAIGRLFVEGQLSTDRVISLAGPSVSKPRLLKTRLGANITQLVDGELDDSDPRVISGSILAGFNAIAPIDFLGRYHTQITALHEGKERIFLGWQRPGFDQILDHTCFRFCDDTGKKVFVYHQHRRQQACDGSNRNIREGGTTGHPSDLSLTCIDRLVTLRGLKHWVRWNLTKKTWPCAHTFALGNTSTEQFFEMS